MKQSIFFFLGLFLSALASIGQTQASGTDTEYISWKNKSPFGITVSYHHKKFDFQNRIPYISYFQSFHSHNPTQAPEVQIPPIANPNSKQLTVNNTRQTIRLEADYWIFPFINIYGFGGKSFSLLKTGYGGLSIPIDPDKIIHYKDNSDGWEYGFGGKAEYFYKNFIPQVGYSMYWTHFDEVNDRTQCQEIHLKLGYQIPFNRSWIKNVKIEAGTSLDKMKFKHEYGRFIVPDKNMMQNEQDAAFFTMMAAQIQGIKIQYQDGYFIFPTEKDKDYFNNLLERITTTGFIQQDFPYSQFPIENYSEWNMTLGAELELKHDLHCKIEAAFLGPQTAFSVSVSYRLFKKE